MEKEGRKVCMGLSAGGLFTLAAKVTLKQNSHGIYGKFYLNAIGPGRATVRAWPSSCSTYLFINCILRLTIKPPTYVYRRHRSSTYIKRLIRLSLSPITSRGPHPMHFNTPIYKQFALLSTIRLLPRVCDRLTPYFSPPCRIRLRKRYQPPTNRPFKNLNLPSAL